MRELDLQQVGLLVGDLHVEGRGVTELEHLDTVRELLHPDEYHVIADCGHMVPFEDPHGTARTITATGASDAPRVHGLSSFAF